MNILSTATYPENRLKRIELYILKPFEAMFDFIARHISYTYALAFLTSMGGFLIAVYIALFLSTTLHFNESGTGSRFILLFVVLTFAVYAPGYYLHFGLLDRLGVPGFTRKLRIINRYIRSNELKPPDDDKTFLELLTALEGLPGENMKAAVIYPSIVMGGVVIQELVIGLTYNAVILLIGTGTAVVIYFFSSYIAAELLTGHMRKRIKQNLVERGISFREMHRFSIRRKFIFIVLLIFISMTELGLMFYFSVHEKSISMPFIFIVLTSFLVGSLLFYYLVTIQNSLHDIEEAAQDLARGGKGKLYLRGLDREIVNASVGLISAAYEVNEIRSNLEKKVEERTAKLNAALEQLRDKDRLFQMELDIASDIQKGILPKTPVTINGLKIVAHNENTARVGGDMYDIIPMRNNSIGVLIADVSGHGVPAALVTTMAKICFRETTQNCLSPKKIFFDVNQMLTSTIKTGEFLTSFLLVISHNNDVLYSNAAHTHALVLRKGTDSIEYWDTQGFFVGAMKNEEVGSRYEEKLDSLHHWDRLLLYTDGIIEARNGRGEEFGMVRLEELMAGSGKYSLEEAKEHILTGWKEYIGDTPVDDDVTLVLLEAVPIPKEALIRENRDREAADVLSRSLEINSHDSHTHKLLGRVLFHTRSFEPAVDHLKYAIKIEPDDTATLYFLSAALYNMKDYNRAFINAHTLSEMEPQNEKPLIIMARSLKKLERPDEAMDIWKKILEIDPENAEAREMAGE